MLGANIFHVGFYLSLSSVLHRNSYCIFSCLSATNHDLERPVLVDWKNPKNCLFLPESRMRSESVQVFTDVIMKNAVFWNVTPCGSCKNRRFGRHFSKYLNDQLYLQYEDFSFIVNI
jgi:hypothetical protein